MQKCIAKFAKHSLNEKPKLGYLISHPYNLTAKKVKLLSMNQAEIWKNSLHVNDKIQNPYYIKNYPFPQLKILQMMKKVNNRSYFSTKIQIFSPDHNQSAVKSIMQSQLSIQLYKTWTQDDQ